MNYVKTSSFELMQNLIVQLTTRTTCREKYCETHMSNKGQEKVKRLSRCGEHINKDLVNAVRRGMYFGFNAFVHWFNRFITDGKPLMGKVMQ